MKVILSITAFVFCLACHPMAFASSSKAAPEKAETPVASEQMEAGAGAADTKKEANSIQWLAYDEVEIGKTGDKKVILHFFADWCHYCKEMDKKTFTKKSVYSYINEHFVPIKVNRDKEKKAARKYPARGLPSTWFFKADGKKITELPGFVAHDTFLNILKYIESDSFDKMNFVEFLEQQKK